MSISRACYVSCDGCGRPGTISCFGAAEARRFASSEGFVRRDNQDLCPDCSGREGVLVRGIWHDFTPEEAAAHKAYLAEQVAPASPPPTS